MEKNKLIEIYNSAYTPLEERNEAHMQLERLYGLRLKEIDRHNTSLKEIKTNLTTGFYSGDCEDYIHLKTYQKDYSDNKLSLNTARFFNFEKMHMYMDVCWHYQYSSEYTLIEQGHALKAISICDPNDIICFEEESEEYQAYKCFKNNK